MKSKSTVWFILIIFMAGFSIHAEEPKKTASETKKKAASMTFQSTASKKSVRNRSLDSWLNRMKKKLAKAQTKHNKLVAVAAVRGDETADVTPLYWKGKGSSGPVSLPELQEFDDAINLSLNGDDASARGKLEAFIQTHPQSPLLEDARQTLTLLNQEVATP